MLPRVPHSSYGFMCGVLRALMCSSEICARDESLSVVISIKTITTLAPRGLPLHGRPVNVHGRWWSLLLLPPFAREPLPRFAVARCAALRPWTLVMSEKGESLKTNE